MLNFVRRLFGRTERRALNSDFFQAHNGSIHVDQTTCLGLPVVQACVRVIAETIGSLPLPTYQRLDNGGRFKDRRHPNYFLLHDRPNAEQSAMDFWEFIVAQMCLWGWGYAEIQRTNDGRNFALWGIPSANVKQEIKNGKRVFHLQKENRDIAEEDMLAFSNFMGKSPITLARETIAAGLAAQRHGQQFWTNWGNQPAHYECTVDLKPEARSQFLKSKQEKYDGPDQAGKEMVLPFGWKRVEHGMPHTDAQWIESMNFRRTEICAIFRVPPNYVGDLSRATFSNVEQMSLDFVQHCIRPLAVRIEQEINYKLYGQSERGLWYSEFNLDGLLRGDAVSRAAANATALQHGALTINQWLAQENRNPVDPSIGDVPFILSTLVPVQKSVANPPQNPTSDNKTRSQPAPSEPPPAVRHVLEREIERANRREIAALRRAASKGDIRAVLADLYADHQAYLSDALAAPVAAYRAVGGTATVEGIVGQITATETELRAMADVVLPEQYEETIDLILEKRALIF